MDWNCPAQVYRNTDNYHSGYIIESFNSAYSSTINYTNSTSIYDLVKRLEDKVEDLEKKIESLQTIMDKILKSAMENGNVTIAL